MRLFDFGRNYAKNYASIIRQGLNSGPPDYDRSKSFGIFSTFRRQVGGQPQKVSTRQKGKFQLIATVPGMGRWRLAAHAHRPKWAVSMRDYAIHVIATPNSSV